MYAQRHQNFAESHRIFERASTHYLIRFPRLFRKAVMLLKPGKPISHPLLENLQATTDAINALEANVSDLLARLNNGKGTFAQLLNSPEPLQEVRGTLQNFNKAVNAVTDLSQRTNERIGRLETPLQFGWDYELRYLSLEERLYNELAFVLSPQSKAHYRIGVGVRDETVRFEVQYAHDLTDYLRARAGFMRSRVGVGVDLWAWSRRFGLSVEGVGLTSREPELNAEVALRFFRYGQLLLGGREFSRCRWKTVDNRIPLFQQRVVISIEPEGLILDFHGIGMIGGVKDGTRKT